MQLTNSIFKLMMGAAVLTFSVAVLIFVSKPASAVGESHNPYLPVEESSGGKYTLQYASGVDGNGYFYWQMVIFNRQTGAYKAYKWEDSGWNALFPDHRPFPELP